jgi:hypothetical protein
MPIAPWSPKPVHAYGPNTIPPYLGNGLIGLRCGPVPLLEGLCIVDGLAGTWPGDQVEGFARAPYPVAGDLGLDGETISRLPGAASLVEQSYDFSCGELRTRFRFRPREATAEVEVLTFCSRSLPTLVLQELQIEVDADCDLVVSAGVSPVGVAGRWLDRETSTPGSEEPVVDGDLRWETHGGLSTCGAAYVTDFVGGSGVQRSVEKWDELAPLRTSYRLTAGPGDRYVLRQITALVASQFSHEPHRQAVRLAAMGHIRGWETLRHENRAEWAAIWKGRPLLLGAGEDWQRISDASFFYLHTSAHRSSHFSTSMFGLAYWPNYHYYRGQVMWDVESFAFPPLLLTAPDSAAALLDYRSRHILPADRNAAMNGYMGIQFPWASGQLTGDEVLRTSASLISFEQHVNMSVAHAFAQYVHATGDMDFLRERAWPVLEGVARWIASRLIKTDRGYELKSTLGFAEGRASPVDNDAYVNMAAAVVLREAAEAADRLSRADGCEWRRMAAEIFLPMRGSLVLNHDRFDELEGGVVGATPEALGGIYPFGFQLEPAVEKETIRFYLDRVDPYLGHPMFSAPLGVLAARVGDRALSAKLFREGFAEFINKPWWDANEFSLVRHPDKPIVGPFMANLGGFLGSCLFGLTGVRPGLEEPADWARRKVTMPEGWEGIEVERIWVRGRPAHLVALHGDERACIEF